jgi:uncharacterized protein involved in outer membrane biogenesis
MSARPAEIAVVLILFSGAVLSAAETDTERSANNQSVDSGIEISLEIESLVELAIPALDRFERLGPLRGSARVSVKDGALRLADLRARAAAQGALLEIEGVVADATHWRGIDLAFTLSAPSASWLVAEDGAPGAGPMIVRGRLVGDRTQLRISELEVRTPSSQIVGVVELEQAASGFRLAGRFDAKALNIDEFLGRVQENANPDNRPSSQQVLLSDLIPEMRAELTLDAKRMTLKGLRMDDVKASLTADAGGIRVHSTGGHSDGRYEAALTLKPSDAVTEADIQLKLERVSWKQVGVQFGFDDFIYGGPTDAVFDAHGRGRTFREIAASMNGTLRFHTKRSRIFNGVLDSAGTGFFRHLASLFTPRENRSEMTEVQCMALRLDIRDGVGYAKDGLAVITDKVAMAGTGQVDLRDGSLMLRVMMDAREGLTFSPASLVDSATVSGTLDEPIVRPNAAGTAFKVAGAIATAGLTLLGEKLLDAANASDDACSTVFQVPAPEPTDSRGIVEKATRSITDGFGKRVRKLLGQ